MSVLIVGLLVLTGGAFLLSKNAAASPDLSVAPVGGASPWNPLGGGQVDVIGDEFEQALAKLEPGLREAAQNPQKGRFESVRIMTTNFDEARHAALAAGVIAPISEEMESLRPVAPRSAGPDLEYIIARDLKVSDAALVAIAKLPSTVSVSKALQPLLFDDVSDQEEAADWAKIRPTLQQKVRQMAKDGIIANGGPILPKPADYGTVQVTGSAEVKTTFGLTGSSVNIMILDTGTDFAHPGFSAASPTKWATVTDASSPWFGWPIMMDSGSLELWFGQWTGGANPYPIGYSVGESTWYADTAYEASLVGAPLDATVDGAATEWTSAHLRASDPAEGANGGEDVTDLYVAGGWDANLDLVGHFFAFNTAPYIDAQTEYVVNVDYWGQTTGYDVLADNNIPMTDLLIGGTAWDTTATLSIGPTDVLSAGSLYVYLDDPDPSVGTPFVQGVDYTYTAGTHVLTFTDPIYPNHDLWADYVYSTATVMGGSFSQMNLVPGTETVYLNGAVWASANYAINYAMGTITFTAALGPGDFVEADYDYNAGGMTDPVYAGVTSATDLPEVAIVWAPAAGTEPDVYMWNDASGWAGPFPLQSFVGGEFAYDPINNFAEFFGPKPGSNDAYTISVEMYAGNTTTGLLVDTTPSDGTPLSNYAPADFGFLPYWHGLGGWTKRVAPDLGDLARINRNYHVGASQMSLSGTYHLGVSPDDKLTNLWGERVGLLLVDLNTPGTYDTIFVDVDDDHSFADEKAVTKADPTAWQDITGDGYADLSSGILYWMPDLSTPVSDSFTATGGETTLTLTSQNVAIDIVPVGGSVTYTWPTVTWNGNPIYWMDSSADGIVGFDMDLGNGILNLWQYDLANDAFNPFALTAADAVTADYRAGTALPYSPTLSAEEGMLNFIPENGDVALFYGEFNPFDNHGTNTASAAAAKPFGNFFGVFDVFGTAEDAKLIGGNFAGGTVALEFAGRGYDGIPGTGDEADIISNSWGYHSNEILATSGFDSNARYAQYLTQLYPQTTYMFAASNEGWGYGTVASPTSAPDVISVGAASLMNYRRLYDFFGLAGYDAGPVGCWPVLWPTDPCGPYGDMVAFSARGPSGLGQPKPDVIAPGAFGWGAHPVNDWLDGANAFDLFSGTSWATPVAAGIAALIVDAYQSTHAGVKPTSAMVKELLKSGATDHGFDVLQQGSGFVNASMSVRMAMDLAGMSVSPSWWSPGGYPTPSDSHQAFVNFLRPGESDSTTFTVTNHDTRNLSPTASGEYYTLQDSYSWDYVHNNGATDWHTFASSPGAGGPVDTRYLGLAAGMTAQDTFPSTSYANADFIAIHATAHEVERVAANGDSFTPGIEVHQWTDVNDDGLFDNVPERNRVTYPDGLAPNYAAMKLWVHHPAARFDNALSAVTEGFVLRVRDFGSSVPVSYTITIEFYGRTAWPWMTVSALTPASVAGGGTATFTATASVPAGAAPGAYQGVIALNYENNVSLVPVVINVPYMGFPVHVGGVNPTTSLYDNGAFRGIGGGQYTLGGDLRRFFAEFDIDTARADRVMLYELNWQNAYSDAELYIATAAPYGSGSFEEMDAAVFGPHTMEVTSATKGAVGGTETLTGLGDLLVGPLADGLMLITVQSVQMQGEDLQEEFNVDIGFMETKTTTMDISTNQLAGSAPVTVWANVPLIGGLGTAVTESSSDVFADMPLEFQVDPASLPFTEWLCSMTPPNMMAWDVPAGTIAIKFHITSPGTGDDHDLGIFRDENGNGLCDFGVDTFMAQDADGDSDETVSLDFPVAGTYLVQAGWYASNSNLWTLAIDTTVIGVSAFSASGCPTTTIAPLTITGCDIAWDFLGSTPEGPQSGALFLSPGYAPFALAQKVTVNWQYDTTPPTIADVLPLPGSMTANAVQNVVANIYDNSTLQIDWRSAQLWVDNQDMTLLSKIIAPYANGYGAVTISLTPPGPMTDGVHVATVRAWDYAGNLGTYTWRWTVDTTGPSLVITSPLSTETAQQGGTAMITGTTDSGATVEFQIEGAGIAAMVDPQGRFSGSVNLVSEGRHEIMVVATDALGNSVSETLVFWYDNTAPVITWSISPGQTTNADTAILLGTVSEGVSLIANGIPIFVGADGSWSVTWLLSEGTNMAVLQATDASGRVTTETVVLTRVTTPPTISARAEVAGVEVTEPIQDAAVNVVDIAGTASVAAGTTLRFVLVNGAPATLGTGGTFTLSGVPLNVGANIFHVQAQDSAGNWATASVTVSFTPIRLEVSRSYNSVILAAVAAVLLVVGLFVGMMMGRKPAQPESMPPPMMPMEPMPAMPMPAEEPSIPSPEEMPPMENAEPPKEGSQ